MADVDAKFQAALNVIHNLPKDGPYKPSPTMMLMFYAYYKQATEGKCHRSKPWSFDIINKAKWEAWDKLGSMSSGEAKEKYVVELTKAMKDFPVLSDEQIIEVLPANEQATDFVQSLGQFYEIVDIRTDEIAKLKKLTGKGTNKPNGKPSSFFDNGDHNIDPMNHPNSNGFHHNGFDNHELMNNPLTDNNHVAHNNADSDEEFCDTTNDPVELQDQRKRDNSTSISEPSTLSSEESPTKVNVDSPLSTPQKPKDGGESGTHGIDKSPARNVGFYAGDDNDLINGEKNSPPQSNRLAGNGVNYGLGGSGGSGGNGDPANISEIQERIAVTLLQLQRDMNHVLNRLQTLETITMTKQQSHCCLHNNQTKLQPTMPSWWPFPDLSPKTTVFMFMWPFIVRYIFLLMKRRHRK